MEFFSNISSWIAQHEATLSGLAAMIVLAGVIFTPLGAGLRRLLSSKAGTEPESRTQRGPAPIEEPSQAASEPALQVTGLPSLAVLPLSSMSAEPEHEFLADGLSEDLTTAMAANRHLHVVSRNSTFAYKGQSPDIREVGRELGVRYVLEGSLRPVGEIARVTVQLIASQDGTHVFAEKYDLVSTASAEAQDQLVADIAGALAVQILRAERLRCREIAEEDASAWELLMRSTYVLNHGSPRHAQSAQVVAQLRRAAELEPGVPYVQACCAFALFMSAINGWADDPYAAVREGEAHLDKALALDASDALTHFYLGAAYMYSGRHERAVRFLESSLAINPHQPDALCHLALAHSYLGHFEQAYECYDRADRSVTAEIAGPFRWYRAITLCMESRFEETVEIMHGVIDQIPAYVAARITLALAYEGMGDSKRARAEVMRAKEVDPQTKLSGLLLQFKAHPDPEQAAARAAMIERYWPREPGESSGTS